jgi:hypothetical protein
MLLLDVCICLLEFGWFLQLQAAAAEHHDAYACTLPLHAWLLYKVHSFDLSGSSGACRETVMLSASLREASNQLHGDGHVVNGRRCGGA